MRYGLIADVHANIHALRAALGELERAGVDRYIVAGDLVGYGPYPNECVELIASADAVCVAGNHDLIALGRLSDERCPEVAKRSLRWTKGVLTHETRAFLASLPLRVSAPGGIEVAHGSLDDPQEYVRTEAEGDAQLERLVRERPQARALVLGHTHRPLVVGVGGQSLRVDEPLRLTGYDPVLLNPGAVGQSRSLELRPRARYMILDLECEEAVLGATSYPVAEARAALRENGLSPSSLAVRPSARGALRRARRLLRKSS